MLLFFLRCRRDVQMRDKGGWRIQSILVSFFVCFRYLYAIYTFKLSQHAQNLDPGERDKQENRIMIIGWGSNNR